MRLVGNPRYVCLATEATWSLRDSVWPWRVAVLDISSHGASGKQSLRVSRRRASDMIAPGRAPNVSCTIHTAVLLSDALRHDAAFNCLFRVQISCPLFSLCVKEATTNRRSEERGSRHGRKLGTCCHATRCHISEDLHRSVTLFALCCFALCYVLINLCFF